MRFVELAGEINTAMPQHVLERTAEALAQNGLSLLVSRIGLLGMAYRRTSMTLANRRAWSCCDCSRKWGLR
jgi:UDP-N-acetyl-D-mannosaminuronate dehydrogenase